MGRSSYCTTPGSAYPWTSVKRYILDNQGLVRRMYGDVTHGSVLRHEMDLEAFRYDSLFIPEVRIRTGRARTGKNTKPNRRRSRPQLFPDDITTTTTEDLGSYETIFRVVTQTSLNFGTDEITASYASSTKSSFQDSVLEPQATQTATTDTETIFLDTVSQSENTPATESTSETTLSASTLKSLPEPEAIIKTTAATESVTEKTTTVSPGVETTDTTDKFEERVDTFTAATEKDERKFGAAIDYDYIPLTRIEIISDNSLEAKAYAEDDIHAKEDVDDVYEVKMPEDEPTEAEDKATEEGVTEEAPPKRGINACPVKNEVIAPYWANNTRGETLALLNVYPFEQYVHFEKCAFENHQMLCREGCRCEQQFRLHRLLAFDPKNECRGIFSDWFRFPSCCVCICYDVITEQPKIRGRTGRLETEDLTS